MSGRTQPGDLARMLVLLGGAGTGKSTIAQEICGRLQAMNRLGASFFFVQSDAGDLGSTKGVIPTIAFQLAALQHGFRSHIANAAREYAKFEFASLNDQLKSLIMDPVASARAKNPWLADIPIIIVLDALDEAGDDLVSFLKTIKELIDAQYDIWIFATTRPKFSVEHALSKSGMNATMEEVNMEDIPQDEVNADIQRFLQQHFASLRWRDELLATYPNAVGNLTIKARRLVIYARTIIEYLDHKTPEISVRRLKAILGGGEGQTGMPALDALYATILRNACDDETPEGNSARERVTALTAGLVVSGRDVTVDFLAPLLGLKEEAVIRTVQELRSILSCSSEDLRTAVIRPFHLTLFQFLKDGKLCARGPLFYQSACYLYFAKACLKTLNAVLRHDIFERDDGNPSESDNDASMSYDAPSDSVGKHIESYDSSKDDVKGRTLLGQKDIPAHTQYACKHWSDHLDMSDPANDPELLQLLGEFCGKRLLRWIAVRRCEHEYGLKDARIMLMRAYFWAKEYARFKVTSRILFDGWQFVATFSDAIESSPTHIHTSALSLTPKCSMIGLYAKKGYSNCLVSRRDPGWGSQLYALSDFRDVAMFLRDGDLLALVRDAIEIRESETGLWQATFGSAAIVLAADVHPNNRSFVSFSSDGTVEEKGDRGSIRKYEAFVSGSDKQLYDGKVLYNADGSRIVCFWKGAAAILVWSTIDYSQPPSRIPLDPAMSVKTLSLDCYSNQMAALLTCKDEPTVAKYWNIYTGEEIKSLQVTTDKIYEAVFAKKNKMLVAKHKDKICVWNLEGDRATLSTAMTVAVPWSFDVTRSGDVIAVACDDFAIRFYSANTGATLAVYRGHTDHITHIRFSRQGHRLVSSSRFDETTRVWDTTKEALSANPPSVTDGCIISRTKFSPDGKYIAAFAEEDPRGLMWDGETGVFLTELTGHTAHINALAFSPDSSNLATISSDGVVLLWDMEADAKHPRTMPQPIPIESLIPVDMAFNAGGNLLAIVCKDDEHFVVWIYNISSHDGPEVGVMPLRSEPNNGDPPYLIRFSLAEDLVRVRYVAPGERVRVWDKENDSVEEQPFDADVHSIWVLPFDIEECPWIISTKTKRRLFWLSRCRRPLDSCMDVHGDRLAIGSQYGILTLLDMSRLQDVPR